MSEPQHKFSENYKEVWRRILFDIMDWSEQQVAAWIDKHREALQNPDDMIYHVEPTYWVIYAFVPNELNKKLKPGQRVDIQAQLRAVLDHDANGQMVDSFYILDWKPYKSKVEAVLRNFQTVVDDELLS